LTVSTDRATDPYTSSSSARTIVKIPLLNIMITYLPNDLAIVLTFDLSIAYSVAHTEIAMTTFYDVVIVNSCSSA